jgi:glycosyltransferase involved in cell wall biosynthesis
MNLRWESSFFPNAVGNMIGFASADSKLSRHVGKYANLREEADVVVHFGGAAVHDYQPRKGKFNVLFTMYENVHLPNMAIDRASKFDLIVVPSQWCKDSFAKVIRKPIEVCPLGVDVNSFAYKRRRRKPGEKFRFLYVGAPNPRKYTVLPQLFRSFLSRIPDAELYMKTTGSNLEVSAKLERLGVAEKEGEVVTGDNWIVDNRMLDESELVDLYHSSHAFIFLTCGEGFGLTGLEAMATGLPLVVSNWSGVTEYANSRNSTLVRCDYADHRQKFEDMGIHTKNTALLEPYAHWVGWPDLNAAAAATHLVYSNYDLATKKAKRARETAESLTWDSTAQRLCAILRRYGIV